MKHAMHENSLKTYEEILESLPRRRSQVFQAINDIGIATLEQICWRIKALPHQISGRIGELKNKGFIVQCGNTMSSENRTVSQYKINEISSINPVEPVYDESGQGMLF